MLIRPRGIDFVVGAEMDSGSYSLGWGEIRGGQRHRRWPPPWRARLWRARPRVRDAEGAPKGRSRRRRDGALRTPEQPDPRAQRGGHAKK